jgi:hypothetical protein
MRVTCKPLIVAALAAAFSAPSFSPSHAYEGLPSDFIGSWRNIDRDARGVTRIDILPAGGQNARVTVYRRCGYEECELGRAGGRVFRNGDGGGRDADFAAVLVRFDRDGLRGNVLVRFSPRGDLVTHALLDFREAGGALYSVERFTRAERGPHHPPPPRFSRY